jgi:hypothetical protein
MIKLLTLAFLLTSTIWSDPGITIEAKVIIPDVPTGGPISGEIYDR